MSSRKGSRRSNNGVSGQVSTVGVAVFYRPYRSAMLALLERAPGLVPVDLGAVGEGITHKLKQLQPDAVLLDLSHAKMEPLIRLVRKAQPNLVIVALNCQETEEDLLPLLEAGISGLVPNEASDAEALQTIRSALEGEVYCPPRIVAALIRRVQRSERGSGRGSISNPQLTPRQMQVARYLEQGLSNKEIAARLGIEPSTAKNHVHSILHKLAIHRRGAVQQLRLGDSVRSAVRDREVTDLG